MNNSGREEFATLCRPDSGRPLFRAVEFELGSVRESAERKPNRRTAAKGSDVATRHLPTKNLPIHGDDYHERSLRNPPRRHSLLNVLVSVLTIPAESRSLETPRAP